MTCTGLVFHYIDTRGFLAKYKLHTSAEDLTKNRASRKDVIKFALIQQAAQCVLGYMMADDTELFVPSEHAVAQWARRLRAVELLFLQCIHTAGFDISWLGFGVTASKPASPMVPRQDLFGLRARNATQSIVNRNDVVAYTPGELLVAKAIYWTLFPLFQYVLTMILVDTFQYFTHRVFHVNKWLYSEFPAPIWFVETYGLIGSSRTYPFNAP